MDYVAPAGSIDPDAPYVTGNPATDTEGSIPVGESIEHPMREIVNAITAAGLTPDASDLTQLSSAIKASGFIAGTRMLFAQASAPTGWTQDGSDTANNRMLRVVSGVGSGLGGVDNPILPHAHATSGHQLTIAEIPSHSHMQGSLIGVDNGGLGGYNSSSNVTSGSAVGGDGAHDHGDTAVSFSPRYLSLILCEKN